MARRLSDFDEETVLISSEALCFLRTASEQETLCKFLESTGRQIQTLAVFRDEIAWRASWESQLTKASHDAHKIARAEDEDVSILGDWYFDKNAIKAFWAPFNLNQFEYEAHANIVDVLYKEIGLSLEELQTGIFKNRRRLT